LIILFFMKSTQLFSLTLHLGTYQSFIERITQLALTGSGSYVCVANVHMLAETYKDVAYSQLIREADLVTPDGMPLTWALKLLHNIQQERVAGMDLLPDLLAVAEKKNLGIFFYGGTQEMLEKTDAFIRTHYPSLTKKHFYSPPFRALTDAERQEDIKRINQSDTQLVVVVLGCPKQEKWMAAMKNDLHACMIGLGGALPVLIGMQKRAPDWMQSAGLEWLYRLFQEPRRLVKRYVETNTLFIWLLLREGLCSRHRKTH
jgi:N-acetylglucosaminyldiphosphoundecaprenol N-acetyl-beta-D-mannosaminyltransferase